MKTAPHEVDARLADAPEAPLERQATLHAEGVHEINVHLPITKPFTLSTCSQPSTGKKRLLWAALTELCQVLLVLWERLKGP